MTATSRSIENRISRSMAAEFKEEHAVRMFACIRNAKGTPLGRKLYVHFRIEEDHSHGTFDDRAFDVRPRELVEYLHEHHRVEAWETTRRIRRSDILLLSAFDYEVAAFIILHTDLDAESAIRARRAVPSTVIQPRPIHPASFPFILNGTPASWIERMDTERFWPDKETDDRLAKEHHERRFGEVQGQAQYIAQLTPPDWASYLRDMFRAGR